MLACLENFMAATNSISSNQRCSSATNRRLLSELYVQILDPPYIPTYVPAKMWCYTRFRDLKPLNTLLDRQMNANIFDFGVVREGPKDELTHVSTMQSKPFWNQKVMQPKQSISSWHALIRLNDIQRAFNIDLEHRSTHRFKDQANAIGLYCTKKFKDCVGAVYLCGREHFQTTLAGDHPTAVDKTKLGTLCNPMMFNAS
ncbi:probable serine/threonine-protein kinase PBL19, partial [Tanacetum coccineum]